MLGPSLTAASRYYNSCTDDGTSPGNYRYFLVDIFIYFYGESGMGNRDLFTLKDERKAASSSREFFSNEGTVA
jgi:hypothetical protein